ncbi:MAG: rod shape-determining protein RodA [Elusimicrobia bacterium]|nr:rod shape-determining protein RodA [Elusimicrobiota bacterium]
MKIESSGFRGRIDWGLIAAWAGLVAIGTVAILSTASPLPHYGQIIQRHFLAVGVGTLLFMLALGFNYQVFQDQSKVLYAVAILSLVAVLVLGQVQRGTKGWIRLPFFSFQPAELARILTTLSLAAFLDRRAQRSGTVGFVAGGFALTLPILALIMLQPDFSSTLTFFPMIIGMLYCAGAPLAPIGAMALYGGVALGLPLVWTLIQLHPGWAAASSLLDGFLRLREMGGPFIVAVVAIFALAWLAWRLSLQLRVTLPPPLFAVGALILVAGLASGAVVDRQLKDYQRARFVAFLLPAADPRGASYNVQQAQIAIGSGGLWGKGVFSGTQSKLGFLPERHTDFIFAAVGEEMGFIGTTAVVALYMLLLYRMVDTARQARDRYGFLVCCGLASILGFHLLVNVGMCLGFVPVAGIPLPLLSYGGSNLAMTLFALGIVGNIYSRRYAFY